MSKIARIKEKIANGEIVIGTHVALGYPVITEMFGEAGFDAIWIDMEHTAIDKQEVLLNIMATAGTQAAPIVRIPWNDPVLAKPILEMGAEGLVFPYVRSAEEAKKAVSSCLYPPEGVRGYGPIRAVKYGNIDTMEYIHTLSRDIWKIIQVEHVDAVNDLDAILAIDGVDAIVVGPNDLSGSLGYLGQPHHPEVQKYFPVIAEKCRKAGKPFGTSVGYAPNNKKAALYWLELGVDFIFLSGDTSFLMNGANEALTQVKEIVNR